MPLFIPLIIVYSFLYVVRQSGNEAHQSLKNKNDRAHKIKMPEEMQQEMQQECNKKLITLCSHCNMGWLRGWLLTQRYLQT